MATRIIIQTRVENGVIIRNKKLISDAIANFNYSDITITIQKKRKTRSNNQNRFYWGVIIFLIRQAIKESWGENMNSEQVHQLLKHELNYNERVNEETGEIIKVPKSTTENSTTEMEEYHDECRKFAKEWFNIVIPFPSETLEISFD